MLTDHPRATLLHVPDTRTLPVPDAAFDLAVANAVFEHITQPRAPYIAELWRVLKSDGYLVINETPNKYLPWDFHTTGLPLLPWLPEPIARRVAARFGRRDRNWYAPPDKWPCSGWRGVGYYELAHAIPGRYEHVPELTRPRHRVLNVLGLPKGLLDPYPLLVWRKL